MSRRGPIFVEDRRLPVEYERGHEARTQQKVIGGVDSTNDGSESQASLHSAHVVMVGVPAEIAVAISVASFLIGAALTGMLCCIHHRKAMPKSVGLLIVFNFRFTLSIFKIRDTLMWILIPFF